MQHGELLISTPISLISKGILYLFSDSMRKIEEKVDQAARGGMNTPECPRILEVT